MENMCGKGKSLLQIAGAIASIVGAVIAATDFAERHIKDKKQESNRPTKE